LQTLPVHLIEQRFSARSKFHKLSFKAAIFSWATGIFGKATKNLIDFTVFLAHIVLLVAAALGCLPCGLHLCTCVLGSKQACAQLASAVVAPVGKAG
jgi:hypothetical protein